MIFLMRFIVSGNSMEPTFKPGQTLLVSSIPYLFRQPKVGDIVVIKDPRDGRLLLKWIKTIRNRHSGERSDSRISKGFWTSQNDNEYFVAGDNPKDSTDSRTFGSIERKHIVGKVICVFSHHTTEYEDQ